MKRTEKILIIVGGITGVALVIVAVGAPIAPVYRVLIWLIVIIIDAGIIAALSRSRTPTKEAEPNRKGTAARRRSHPQQTFSGIA